MKGMMKEHGMKMPDMKMPMDMKADMKGMMRTAHGSYEPHKTISGQGESMMMRMPSTQFEEGNPLSSSGKKVMSSMKKSYGSKKGKQVFYATANKNKKLGSKWHK